MIFKVKIKIDIMVIVVLFLNDYLVSYDMKYFFLFFCINLVKYF